MADMVALMRAFATRDGGAVESRLRGVRFFKETKEVSRRPLLYNPGICIVASGHKIAYLGDRAFRYDPDNYLVTSVTMPFECESSPSPEDPLLGMFIDIDLMQLRALISQMGLQTELAALDEKTVPLGLGPSLMDAEIKETAIRLLKALRSETEAAILGPGLVRELYYRALRGNQAPMLLALAKGGSPFSRVAAVISKMHGEYSKKLDVEQLAGAAHMSVSAFHKAFKEMTSDSPMQYLKKIRLTRAKTLLLQKRMKANVAAYNVGYESPSQFSREFKRYFGQTPAEVRKQDEQGAGSNPTGASATVEETGLFAPTAARSAAPGHEHGA